MPSWCNNDVTLVHDDPAMIARVVSAFQAGEFFKEFVPYEGDWNYYWCVDNWGTKWDVGCPNDLIVSANTNEISLTFGSAWSPPIPVYECLYEMGFDIEATYFEGDSCFGGVWVDGEGESWTLKDGVTDEIPQVLVDTYGLHEFFEMFQD